jgi:hypothetical protein
MTSCGQVYFFSYPHVLTVPFALGFVVPKDGHLIDFDIRFLSPNTYTHSAHQDPKDIISKRKFPSFLYMYQEQQPRREKLSLVLPILI